MPSPIDSTSGANDVRPPEKPKREEEEQPRAEATDEQKSEAAGVRERDSLAVA